VKKGKLIEWLNIFTEIAYYEWKLTVSDYTYVAIPLKNIWNRRFVWKVKITI